ncbi:MAG: DUF4834 family protein [Paraprevotella sp.]|nr:DUF4834 family protein [Paraprevotella sp.]
MGQVGCLLLCLIFVLFPILYLGSFVAKVLRLLGLWRWSSLAENRRRGHEGGNGAAHRSEAGSRRKSSSSDAASKKKIFSDDDGEYVDYEEVK